MLSPPVIVGGNYDLSSHVTAADRMEGVISDAIGRK